MECEWPAGRCLAEVNGTCSSSKLGVGLEDILDTRRQIASHLQLVYDSFGA